MENEDQFKKFNFSREGQVLIALYAGLMLYGLYFTLSALFGDDQIIPSQRWIMWLLLVGVVYGTAMVIRYYIRYVKYLSANKKSPTNKSSKGY